MVKTSINTLKRKNIPTFNSKYNVTDFENLKNIMPHFRIKKFNQSIFFFLGGTMGNFKNGGILSSIKDGMQKGDYLIIGNALLKEEPSSIIKSYCSPVMKDFILAPLLILGFKEEELEHEVVFKNSRVNVYFKVLKDKVILNKKKQVLFKKGYKIAIGYSYRFKKDNFKKINLSHFKNTKFYFNKQESVALAFCSV